jgi:hypothetical protein
MFLGKKENDSETKTNKNKNYAFNTIKIYAKYKNKFKTDRRGLDFE